MKKRIFAMALVVGVVLSMCASAWAKNSYAIDKFGAEYTQLNKAEDREGNKCVDDAHSHQEHKTERKARIRVLPLPRERRLRRE